MRNRQAFLMITLEMQHGNEHFGGGEETPLMITSSYQSCWGSVVGMGWEGGGKREAGKSDFCITCIVLAFLRNTI